MGALLKVLFLSAEVEPFAKVGGLADVAGSLPKALSGMGHDAKVVMPAYSMVVNDARWGAKKVLAQFPVNINPHQIVLADLYEIEHEGLKVWLIDGDHYFSAVTRSEEVYSPSREAYLFFSQAALEACRVMQWVPDIVHANDWHMAFAPVFLREKFDWPATSSVYTIHNLAYQGEFGSDTVDAAGLDPSLFNMHQLETWGGVNFLKSGCVFADQVNTVSPTYCQEIQTEQFGCRLQGLMSFLYGQGRLRGILNGIDTELHDPEVDPRIPHHFSANDLDGKALCRASLGNETGLELNEGSPIISVVSRLSDQKGFDMIADCAEQILELDCRLLILAIGDRGMAQRLRDIEAKNPGRFRFVEAYDAELAQRIYAGSDIFLMPSSFEPCGLGQMFAMRYGTVPVVRKTGGLADTVFDNVNGFVFENRSAFDMYSAISRAVDAFRTPRWSGFVESAMNQDHSWSVSAREYVKMYEDALESSRTQVRSASRW